MTARPLMLLALAAIVAFVAILARPTPFVQLDLHTDTPATSAVAALTPLPQGVLLTEPGPNHLRLRSVGSDTARGHLALAGVQQELQRLGVAPRLVVASSSSGAMVQVAIRALCVTLSLALLLISALQMRRQAQLASRHGQSRGFIAARRAST